MSEELSLFGEGGELPEKNKIRWNCRRGMKELEVVLLPFLEYCYDEFSLEKQRLFVRMLGYDDASLYSYFMGYEETSDPEVTAMIQEVQRAVAAKVSAGVDISQYS